MAFVLHKIFVTYRRAFITIIVLQTSSSKTACLLLYICISNRRCNGRVSQRPARAAAGGGAGARGARARARAALLQGEDEDVRAGVGRGQHPQGQGAHGFCTLKGAYSTCLWRPLSIDLLLFVKLLFNIVLHLFVELSFLVALTYRLTVASIDRRSWILAKTVYINISGIFHRWKYQGRNGTLTPFIKLLFRTFCILQFVK